VDDIPYGGGPGMVMKPEPLVEGIEALAGAKGPGRRAQVALLSPQGAPFTGQRAKELAGVEQLVLVCGRYEGVDERVRSHVDEEISLGDFVLTGGELVALAVLDAVGRLLPGVLGNADSPGSESFEEGLLEYPQYTRPPDFRGAPVPDVLQGGDHARIARWRRWHQLQLTKERRPDLLAAAALSDDDRRLLQLEEKDL
jgi:tRNA (guanine37-N1)-methyltransferase